MAGKTCLHRAAFRWPPVLRLPALRWTFGVDPSCGRVQGTAMVGGKALWSFYRNWVKKIPG